MPLLLSMGLSLRGSDSWFRGLGYRVEDVESLGDFGD